MAKSLKVASLKNKLLSLSATLLLIAISTWAQQSPAQTPKPATDDVENYSLEANSFIDALLKISAQFQFPMGVEWVKSADTLKPVRFSRPRTTMKEIIQAVVSTPAGYDWRMEDGVVHVFQRGLMEDPRNPLNVVIKSFDEKPETVGWANNDLSQMVDEVVRHPELSGIGGSILGYPGEPVFRFAAENVPARFILNEIVMAGLLTAGPSMQRIWIATFPEPPTFTRIGSLEVVPTFASDQNQPFWNLLSWGAAPLANMVK
jgi:hypothetical protein